MPYDIDLAVSVKKVHKALEPEISDPTMDAALSDLCDRIMACANIVSETLGAGLPEIIYENALAHEMRKEGLAVSQQHAVPLYYDETIVGDYTADLLVENTVMVELKPVTGSKANRTSECRNYLHATGLKLCMLFGFGDQPLAIESVVKGP